MHLLHTIVLFAIVLGILVLVHEFGHFAVAKLCGVRVEIFSIGFGPRLFGVRYQGTDYRISALPLGGYVKMAGDAPGEAPKVMDVLGVDINLMDDGEFNARPRWQRILIALSGPVANFILSFFLLAALAHFHHEIEQYRSGAAIVDYVPVNSPMAGTGIVAGDAITSFNGRKDPSWDTILQESQLEINRTIPISYTHNGQSFSRELNTNTGHSAADFGLETMLEIGLIPREQSGPIGLASIAGGTPADRAGLHAGDQIVHIDNLTPHSVDTLHAYLKDRAGAPANLTILRNGQTLNVTLIPEHVDNVPAYAAWQIGFQPVAIPVVVDQMPLGASFAQSIRDNRDDSTLVLRILKGMFTRHVAVSSLSGPVGIAQQIDIATQNGTWSLVRLMSAISLQLGIFNLLPLPILDGGMIVFLLIESVMRRDVNVEIKERVYQVAFVCFLLFFAFVMFNDVSKLHIGH